MIGLMAVTSFILGAYVLLLILLISGLKKLQTSEKPSDKNSDVSIIIPFRNEEANLPSLLDSLEKLCFSERNAEVIFINDHSADAGEQLIRNFIKRTDKLSVKIINLSAFQDLSGKKDAQKTGVDAASYDYLLFTDADCIVKPEWVNSMLSYAEKGIQMVCGFVELKRKSGFLQHFYYTEFLSLVLSGAGASGIKKPVYCNGANMLLHKKAYQKVIDKTIGKKYATGDDVFLLHAIISEFGNPAVRFAASTTSIVETIPPENFPEFLNQRTRWASKAKSYHNGFAIFMALTVFLTSLYILLLLPASFFYRELFPFAILILVVKTISDASFFYLGRLFHGMKYLHLLSFPFQIIYIPYIVLTAILSIILPGKWKGRKIIQK